LNGREVTEPLKCAWRGASLCVEFAHKHCLGADVDEMAYLGVHFHSALDLYRRTEDRLVIRQVKMSKEYHMRWMG
jgi:hypothetical protein